jgi:hypothetical protein
MTAVECLLQKGSSSSDVQVGSSGEVDSPGERGLGGVAEESLVRFGVAWGDDGQVVRGSAVVPGPEERLAEHDRRAVQSWSRSSVLLRLLFLSDANKHSRAGGVDGGGKRTGNSGDEGSGDGEGLHDVGDIKDRLHERVTGEICRRRRRQRRK